MRSKTSWIQEFPQINLVFFPISPVQAVPSGDGGEKIVRLSRAGLFRWPAGARIARCSWRPECRQRPGVPFA